MKYRYLALLWIFLLFVSCFFVINPLKAQTNSFEADSIKADELNLEGINFSQEGDYESALNLFLESLDIRKRIYGEDDIRLASVYTNISNPYRYLGRLNEAIESLLKAEEIYLKYYGNEFPRLGRTYGSIGHIYRQKGNFSDALKYHQKALSSFLNDSSVYILDIQAANYNICELLFLTKEYDNAIELIYKNLNELNPYNIYYYNLLANTYLFLNEIDNARIYFKKSIEEQIRLSGDENFDLTYYYINYANFLISIQEFENAENQLKLAEPIIDSITSGKGEHAAFLYYTYGDFYAKQVFDSGSFDDFREKKTELLNNALDYYQKALFAVTNDFSETEYFLNPTQEQIDFETSAIDILQRKSEAFYQLSELFDNDSTFRMDNLRNALDAISMSSDLLNKLRTEAVSEESKILISEQQNTTFINTISLAYELFALTGEGIYFEKAFQNAERNKAASLMDNLSEESARELSLIPDSLIKKEENINLQITYYNEKLYEARQNQEGNETIEEYENQLFQLRDEKNELNYFLETNFSEYYQLKYASDQVSVSDVQNKLSNDEAILEYVMDVSDEKSAGDLYLFVITKVDYYLAKIDIQDFDIQNIETLYGFLSDPDYIHISYEKYAQYVTSAYNLYSLLVEPVDNYILNRSVTIVPDGIISYLPFDAFLYEMTDLETINFRDLPYLIKRNLFNYSYSANLYLNEKEKSGRNRKNLVAFAPEYKYNESSGDEDFDHLLPLSGIITEVENISKRINSDLFIGSEATEFNFKDIYEEYDILHLAMHTLINDSLPMFSKLAFSQDKNTEEDGWLTTQEIYNLELKASLAVLSACNTGSGVLKQGEGVISLARGFFYAGCPTVIMTLWEVEDRSGTSIMDEFYRFLKNGKDIHESLRLAKLEHIESADPLKAHPHFWLGYVSIGNTDAMFSGNDIYFYIILIVIAITVLTDQIIRHKKTRKNRVL